MRGLFKGRKFTRAIVFTVALTFVFIPIIGHMAIKSVKADSDHTFASEDGGNTSVKGILSSYQLFSVGDMSLENHQMGAVCCGGIFNDTNSAFGNASVVNSYIKTVGTSFCGGEISTTDTTDTNYKSYKNTKYVYYNNDPNGKVSSWQRAVKIDNEYIDCASVGASLASESASWITNNSAVQATSLSDGKLTIDLSLTPNVWISAADYAKTTTIALTGLSSVDAFSTGDYSITIKGTNVDLNCSNITFNGVSFAQALKQMTGIIDSQAFSGGMKLIWNFPEATTATASNLSGHVLAPLAALEIEGGNYEGCVIANSVVACSAEGHFYGYYALGKTPTASPKSTTPAPTTEAPATETPTASPKSTTPAPTTEAPKTEAPATEAPATEAPATEAPKTEAPATEKPVATTAAPVATTAAPVATTAAPVATTAAPVATTAVPTSTNTVAPTSTPAVGNLVVTIYEDGTKTVIPNATVQVYDSTGKLVTTTTTDANGKITLNSITTDTYTIKVTSVPDGYTIPTTTQTASVTAGTTTEKEFVVKTSSATATPDTEDTEDEDDSDDEDDSSSETSSTSVDTGDTTNMPGYIIVFSLAGILLIGATVIRIRK